MESYTSVYSVSDFFHLVSYFRDSLLLLCVSVVCSFLLLSDSLLYGYTTGYFSIHQFMGVWIASDFWPLSVKICVNICVQGFMEIVFQFFGVKA